MNNYTTARNYGLLWGTISILIYLTIYLVTGAMDTGAFLGFIIFAGGIAVMYFIGLARRNELGGYLEWKEAMVHIWIGALIATAMTTLFLVLMYNYIDPSLLEHVKEVQIKTLEEFRGRLGDAETEKQIERIQDSNPFGPGNSALIMAGGALLQFLISCLVALVVRKDNPNSLASGQQKFSDRF
ncbi:MAG: DUF4199 domain-containing protein [Saprospiraceae bacterium]|nr:DUF4199 domain-containing protein [Saprospiraceae bacterium]HMW38144.1 DUF4199 domain-containing protein [Saprospiraceae bacterium]HMX87725.1 DUF4199 domain-containing protein [Saprospiraceae bacterium]HMZ39540.1 DUF4199 domain-containing protein [Saprospiraceae bacterium]HNA63087.1 DUF4199 domain-containing protein [Saprospiraceae bacterium]